MIVARPSRSTLEIKVGVNKDLTDRTELRSWADVKPAYLRDDMVDAERPKRGRPRKSPPIPEVTQPKVENSSGPTPSDASLLWNNNNPKPTSASPNLDRNYNLRPRTNVNYASAIDVTSIKFSKPPPPIAGNSNFQTPAAEPRPQAWSASSFDLSVINSSIRGV